MAQPFSESPHLPLEDRPHTPHPADKEHSQSGSTPAIARHTGTVAYSHGGLQHSRAAVFKDLGKVHIVENELFEEFLPPQPNAQPPDISDHIMASKKLKGWDLWPKEPAKTEGKENEVFKAFSSLIRDIIEATQALRGGTPTVSHINNPTSTPFSDRMNTSQPDGYFVLNPNVDPVKKTKQSCWPYTVLKHALDNLKCECGCKINWEDIAAAFEYKKHNDEKARLDDEHKIIWSLHHIMRNDPCRRFAFGITVENTHTRVWLCHRAGTVVSKGFNFMKDHNRLIRLISSLAFASKTELGWDPTVVALVHGDRIAHQITVRNTDGKLTDFITTEVISDFGAEAMRGRGTRVWAASKFINGNPEGPPVVIKDVWQDQDRSREGDFMAAMMCKLGGMEGVDMEDARRHFLTVLLHGDVHVDGEADATLSKIMRGTDVPWDSDSLLVLPPEHPLITRSVLSAATSKTSQSSVGQAERILAPSVAHLQRKRIGEGRQGNKPVMYHRQHYRIVFKERGKSLHQLDDMGLKFDALIDATQALAYMWKCGLVHRDVSPGNILLVDGRGVLADLEYAKSYSPGTPNTSDDGRTGTSHFMAIEIATEVYHFAVDEEDDEEEAVEEPPIRSILHNPLHDAESLWWIGTWSVVSYSVEEASGTYDPTNHHSNYLRMFPETTDHITRMGFITGNAFATTKRTFPPEFRKLVSCLQSLRNDLARWYKTAYMPFRSPFAEADRAPFDSSHAEVIRYFRQIRAHIDSIYESETKVITLQDALNAHLKDLDATPK